MEHVQKAKEQLATAAKMFNVDIANVTYEQRQAGKKANFSALYK